MFTYVENRRIQGDPCSHGGAGLRRKGQAMRIESVCLGQLATNCYLIDILGVIVLVDPAEPNTKLLSFIGDRRVDLIVNTHGHFDHVGGNWLLKEQGARIFLHREDLPLVDRCYPGHAAIDCYLKEGDKIAGELAVLHLPGHSPGSIALLADGVLFSGDLLFAGSIGRTDLPGGSMPKMIQSLKRIVELDGDYQVYPGHGETTTLDRERRTNPFLRNLVSP